MWLCQDLASFDGTLQVAGNKGVDRLVGQLLRQFTSLATPGLIEFTLRSSLHHLECIVYGLTMAN